MPIKIRLPKYTDHFVDRCGRAKYYFRQKGGPRIALPGLPWSPEFMQAYAEALRGVAVRPKGTHHIAAGSVEAALVRYYQSGFWLNELGDDSRDFRRPILEHFRKVYGTQKMRALKRSHIQALIGSKKPGAQGNWMKALRHFCKFAMAENIIDSNPTADIIKSKQEKTGGFRPWVESDVTTYRAHYALGTRERLAMELMLNLGVRVSDARQIGPGDVKNNLLTDYQPQKGRSNGGQRINVPVHPDLRKAIAATAHGLKSYLVTTEGTMYTAQYLSQKVSDWCREAGLPNCTAHGLRKLCLTRLADAGCTPWEIMSISGHKTLSEVQRYTEAANRKKLAFHATAKRVGILLKGNTAAELEEELGAHLAGEALERSQTL